MIYLVSTPQRCGSTWLVKMLAAMAGARDLYLDGLVMGFGLTGTVKPGAVALTVIFPVEAVAFTAASQRP